MATPSGSVFDYNDDGRRRTAEFAICEVRFAIGRDALKRFETLSLRGMPPGASLWDGLDVYERLSQIRAESSFCSIANCKSKIANQNLVASQHADDDALDSASVGIDDPRLHRGVCGLKTDLVAGLFVKALERRFAGVEQGDDLLAVACGLAALDYDVVAVAEVVFDHALAADAQAVHADFALEHRFEIDFFAVFDGFDGRAGGDVAEERELGVAVLVGEPLIRDDLQRASLVLVAAQDALFFQSADVLEDGDLARSELVGQLLHGRGIAMQVAIVSNRDDDVELPGREIHKALLQD